MHVGGGRRGPGVAAGVEKVGTGSRRAQDAKDTQATVGGGAAKGRKLCTQEVRCQPAQRLASMQVGGLLLGRGEGRSARGAARKGAWGLGRGAE